MKKTHSFSSFLRRDWAPLLLTAGLFALVYATVFSFRLGMSNDFLPHIAWAIYMTPDDYLSVFVDGSERLWHIFVSILYYCGLPNVYAAAAIVTAAADAAAYYLVYKTLDPVIPQKFPRWLLALITVSVFVVNALTVPGQDFYITKGAINTWHNPTNIMVRPFAAAVFFMTVRIYNRRRYGCHQILVTPPEDGHGFTFEGSFWAQFRQPVYKPAEIVLYPICLLLSAYAKPSFLQFFGPAILVFLLIDVFRTKGMLLPFCIKLALAYVPVAFVILSQFTNFFGSNGLVSVSTVEAAGTAEAIGSGFAVYFVRASYDGIGDILLEIIRSIGQILYLCALPLFILVLDGKRSMRTASFRLGLISMIIAQLEALFLHETGGRASHGNFLWGYYLSTWLLWCASVSPFVQLLQDKSTRGKIARWGGTPLLLWHLVCGILYIIRIFQTHTFWL